MSKFQVGDKVTAIDSECVGKVVAVGDMHTFVNWGDAARSPWYSTGSLRHAGPHVPDVDGNPIRVGQLVSLPDRHGCFWVQQVKPHGARPIAYVEGDPDAWGSTKLRVVTDTFRPPEPDTRDVTLRVTMKAGQRVPSEAVRAEVQEAIEDFYAHPDVTVEVVDDGGHDDG